MTPLEAVQACLRGEHAAVYLLGVLGARADASGTSDLETALRDAYDTHLRRRDQLEATVRRLGGTPAIAAVAYRLPSRLRTTDQVRAAALVVESRCAAAYAQQVGSTVGETRQWALAALLDSAVRELDFGGSADAFPGLAELMAP